MAHLNRNKSNRPMTVTIDEAKELTGLGRTSIYKLMKQGKLQNAKVIGRTLIDYDGLERLVTPHKKHDNDLSDEGNA